MKVIALKGDVRQGLGKSDTKQLRKKEKFLVLYTVKVTTNTLLFIKQILKISFTHQIPIW